MFEWNTLINVCLDMDGPLLDLLHFDKSFLDASYLPQSVYAELTASRWSGPRPKIYPFDACKQGQLDWLLPWISGPRELGLPIVELKREIAPPDQALRPDAQGVSFSAAGKVAAR